MTEHERLTRALHDLERQADTKQKDLIALSGGVQILQLLLNELKEELNDTGSSVGAGTEGPVGEGNRS